MYTFDQYGNKIEEYKESGGEIYLYDFSDDAKKHKERSIVYISGAEDEKGEYIKWVM